MIIQTLQTRLNDFHKAFNHPRDVVYERVSIDKIKSLRIKLIREEFKEVMSAIQAKKDKDSVLKELCDLVYVCVGFADTFGWNLDEAFIRVHNSNMSKLDKDDKPIYRDDGKILKSAQYKEPNLEDLV